MLHTGIMAAIFGVANLIGAPPAPHARPQPPQITLSQAAPHSAERPSATAPNDRRRQLCLSEIDPDTNDETVGRAPEAPSERLPRSADGVICPPPGVDPEMAVKPPRTGSRTPVIPPPGSPGGDLAVRQR
jgi:hypothetical protein